MIERGSVGAVDQDVANSARLYDYLLGGGHNFASDRALAQRFLAALPSARDVARLNRSFLRRAVALCCQQGVRQILDLGSGIPTVGNVHEIAQRLVPDTNIVYVDREPVACTHAHQLLADNDRACIVQADIRNPAEVLTEVDRTGLLDFGEPVALIMAGVIHFVALDEDAPGLVQAYGEAFPPGSYLALSHFTGDISPDEMARVVEVMQHSSDPIHLRTHAQINALFDGFQLVDPGIVGTAFWRPEWPERAGTEPGGNQIYAGVGCKKQNNGGRL